VGKGTGNLCEDPYLTSKFGVAVVEYNMDQPGFKYNIIDMSLDGGLGAVTEKILNLLQSSK